MSMPMSGQAPDPAFIGLFVLLAAASLVAGFYFANKRQYWLTHSVVTKGIIVDVYKKYGRGDQSRLHPFSFPKVKYDANGKQFVAAADEALEQDVQIGQVIEVRYNPANPAEASLGVTSAPGINPKLFYLAGGLFVLMSLIFLA
jgi:hypothetical protein